MWAFWALFFGSIVLLLLGWFGSVWAAIVLADRWKLGLEPTLVCVVLAVVLYILLLLGLYYLARAVRSRPGMDG